MLTNGKLKQTTFRGPTAFADLARAVADADRAKAEGLRKTSAARAANRARRASTCGRVSS